MSRYVPAILFFTFFSSSSAFLVKSSAIRCKISAIPPSQNILRMSSNDENGYGPVGTLIRQGPVPFFIRLAKPDTYEAAVLKYMNGEKCSRGEAMANMDAYFQDPNGWAAEKLKSRRTGIKLDYLNFNQSPESLILTAIWSLGLLAIIARLIQVQVIDKM